MLPASHTAQCGSLSNTRAAGAPINGNVLSRTRCPGDLVAAVEAHRSNGGLKTRSSRNKTSTVGLLMHPMTVHDRCAHVGMVLFFL